tara:strand:- start:150 stop:428 length:279 start_codon:yes stop_codon:yes gene_type:complete
MAEVLLSTVDLKSDYETIGPIFSLASSTKKWGVLDIDAAFDDSRENLKMIAKSKGADAVVGLQFEHRIAIQEGWTNKQVLEIFAYGTAVKLK